MFQEDLKVVYEDISDRIANRRQDDIVIIIRHDFSLENHKNYIVIEYMNDYGCKFFNIPLQRIVEDGSGQKGDVLFSSLLSQKTRQLLYEGLIEESENNFESRDLAELLRKISNFTMINGNREQTLVILKPFPFYKNQYIGRKKTIVTNYYYLIIRSTNLSMRIASYRLNFLEKIGAKISLDPMTKIHTIQSSINELKMLIQYNNSHKIKDENGLETNKTIMVAIMQIDGFYEDQVLMSIITDILSRNLRADDFVGHFSQNQFIIIFYNLPSDMIMKPLSRVYNLIRTNKYVFNNYNKQKEECILIGYTSVRKSDDLGKVNIRLKRALEICRSKIEGVRIMSDE